MHSLTSCWSRLCHLPSGAFNFLFGSQRSGANRTRLKVLGKARPPPSPGSRPENGRVYFSRQIVSALEKAYAEHCTEIGSGNSDVAARRQSRVILYNYEGSIDTCLEYVYKFNHYKYVVLVMKDILKLDVFCRCDLNTTLNRRCESYHPNEPPTQKLGKQE